jgi:hypothetical protein
MRALVTVALLALLAIGGALFVIAGDEGRRHGGENEGADPSAVREVQPPARARDPGRSRRPARERQRRAARGRPAARERARRPGELRLSDRPECRVPDAFDVPGCSSHP